MKPLSTITARALSSLTTAQFYICVRSTNSWHSFAYYARIILVAKVNYSLFGYLFFYIIKKIALRLLGVIDYNVLCFREAISQVFELRSKSQSKMNTSIEMMDGSVEDETEFSASKHNGAEGRTSSAIDQRSTPGTSSGGIGLLDINDASSVLA